MASVTSESRNGRTRYRIEWRDADKRPRKMRLAGETDNKKDAQAIARKVTAIVSASISKEPLSNSVSQWLTDIGDELHAKLSAAGLAKPRQSATLGEFIDAYIAGRGDAAANTIRNWHNSRDKLTQFFGKDAGLRDIASSQADDWRQWLVNQDYSNATVSKAVKHAKQFLRAATRKGFCESNPFIDLKAGGEENADRKAFISQEMIATVLDAAPDAEWRAIIALARYGGLRCPSEVLGLEWTHIDWQADKFTVTSPKTKRHGKGWRVVPLFPELRVILAEAQEVAAAGEGSRFVVSRYRDRNANLRTQFERILRKANVEPWQRLFHNLRASRQTELMNSFPAHVVCDWLGNTEAIANKHYLQTTDEHFALAQGGGTGGDNSTRNDSQRPETVPSTSPTFPKKSEMPRVFAAIEYPQGESNPCCRTENPES